MRLAAPPEFGGVEARILSPADRVSQKGSDACKAITEAVCAGVGMKKEDRLLLVDMNPNAAGDWGAACWDMMKMKLSAGGDSPFPGMISFPVDAAMAKALSLAIHRKLADEWWDHNPEAGPRDPAQLSETGKPSLQLATWTETSARLPDAWIGKFDQESDHHGPWMSLCRPT